MKNDIPTAKSGKKAKLASKKDNESVCAEPNIDATAEEWVDADDPIIIAQTKCAEYKDIAQRVKAEYENYRKRTQEESKQLFFDGASCVLGDLLDLIDNFDRALTIMTAGKDKEGVVLIKKQLDAILQKYNVEEIQAIGKPFNPDLHNAVLQVEQEGECGQIVEVLQKGYIRQGKVLRYSMVKVAI